jgi:hypothetical protein
MEPALACNRWSSQDPIFAILFVSLVIFVFLVVIVVKTLICCRIFSKAGYSWALGLLMLVPIANIIMLFVLAFGDWPIYKELRLLRQQKTGTA